MCGITGFISKRSSQVDCLTSMVESINHRGPNDRGLWIDEEIGVYLAHARLSIQDLSSAGHQPMHSKSERYVMIFNGEIYNHLVLRKELFDIASGDWNGHSDTETLLAGFEMWGIEQTIQKCVGMFAIVLWDKELKQLVLIRDRFGEKPLYYGWQDGTFLFSSELKALKSHPSFEGKINREALSYFFRLNYIPTPLSIYEDIFKLEPGIIAIFSNTGQLISKQTFWDVSHTLPQQNFTDNDAVDKLDDLIRNSIQDQALSDVPLGAFLSGGIDSSTVVGILQSMSTRPVKTFTIGFDQVDFNEASEAADVAKYLGTDHVELIVSAEDVLAVINQLPIMYDEPFADASQVPTFLVSQLAKKEVTVCLSGDGGDELFCGYNRYHYTAKVWSKLKKIPFPIRKILSVFLLTLSPSSWDVLSKALGLNTRLPNLGNKIQKGAQALKARDIEDLYTRVVSNWDLDEPLVKNTAAEKLPFLSDLTELSHLNDLEKMMLWDKQSYLMDDVLVKTDRATMACSLEGRVPLLDHRIAEFAASLPMHLKYRDGMGKWILREVLYRYVPKKLIERPKKGFSLPVAEWLRGPLREWANVLLDSDRIDNEGFLSSELVQKKWREHLSGKRDWSSQLWSVLMFQLWLEKNK
ncbi:MULTISPECIES: asparagine synthase (glutamine-hydrolyzing) [Marinomonas]|uniref:asparagine synthase (glutamine-hydrolyzing) n=1 Tax=Marinomonas arctica TaxID=383750 RepID=A0A7H1J451_9GAMM|nr:MULTISPECIES: asparagine synthase (glutamine-hydrolyzing) [Marinomonas]MCS7487753.1 asparagine synthase [Marinomonas sp. BSi20414]QNT05267.1 asparagine synthase (glutamine-hydrolyzing) [Marinomonas arctica]GGN38550.1 asparagine synthetase B [Marinomonas arctica]